MNFSDNVEEAAIRAEMREWISANAPSYLEKYLKESSFETVYTGPYDWLEETKKWQLAKAEGGWACLQWPVEYGGRGASAIERVIWSQEEGIYGLMGMPFIIGQGMCGPTLMAYASEEHKRRYLPKLASGDEIWCQLFSEPHGGSDLAGLRTRARQSGDEWIINGHKIWTSCAHYSDFGILITRTDPSAIKHKGLTMFFVDMRSEGIEISPIKQANGKQDFNEVFLRDVRIPDSQRLGEVGDGWRVALTTLMNERLAIGGSAYTGLDELIEAAKVLPLNGSPAIDNAAVRSRIARWYVKTAGLKNTAARMISALSRGDTPGPESSITKLVSASVMHELSLFGVELQGLSGVLIGQDVALNSAKLQNMMLRAPGVHIEGGTDQILRNIIGERVLGLPEDMRADKGIPFDKIPNGMNRQA